MILHPYVRKSKKKWGYKKSVQIQIKICTTRNIPIGASGPQQPICVFIASERWGRSEGAIPDGNEVTSGHCEILQSRKDKDI